jgi:uncharacterized protein with GYD domain
MNLSTQVLVFQNTEFNVIEREGQCWVRSPQVGDALGYTKARISVDKIFKAHADEFTDRMTAVVELMTAGGKQMVRIFSLRGAHLLAMFARTPVAKAFRRWVLDILDQEVVRARPVRALGPRHLGEIKAILAKRVMEAVTAGVVDPMNQHRAIERAYRNIAAALLARFAVADVTEIPAAKFLAAREFVETVAVDWELVDEPVPKDAPVAQPICATTKEDIERLCADAEFIRSWWKSFGPAIELLNAQVAGQVSEHIVGAAAAARHLVHRLGLKVTEQYASAYPWRGDPAARRAYAALS